jgi:hypothetical protein
VIPKFHSWLAPLQAFALVISPRLGLQQIWLQRFVLGLMAKLTMNMVCFFFFPIISSSSIYYLLFIQNL